ncbi:calcium-binding and spermatid-specific protein 1 [Heterocephalus glaber]|uniref:Calcium-binding and spermatid-specific protein 1 n=1 Tax=Heterocephalus glaber TaxID=10181 RepID=A0AAX6QBX6_HETGA|nr:calcium-binding and spermatid-specific protein 1 [Heterocephalus glaber]
MSPTDATTPSIAYYRALESAKLSDTEEEKFITVFELTTSAEKDQDNFKETLSDEESTYAVNVWMQRHTIKEAETNSVLLTAAESRYDFTVTASEAVTITGEPATDTTEDLPENNATESVPEDIESRSDTPNYEKDTSMAASGIFKLLKEDPDELMM